MGLIPEIDRIDEDEKLGIEALYIKGPPQLYREFACEYIKQGHTWTEAWELICDDLRRRDPKLYDEEYLKDIMERAKKGEAYLNALNNSEHEWPAQAFPDPGFFCR